MACKSPLESPQFFALTSCNPNKQGGLTACGESNETPLDAPGCLPGDPVRPLLLQRAGRAAGHAAGAEPEPERGHGADHAPGGAGAGDPPDSARLPADAERVRRPALGRLAG